MPRGGTAKFAKILFHGNSFSGVIAITRDNKYVVKVGRDTRSVHFFFLENRMHGGSKKDKRIGIPRTHQKRDSVRIKHWQQIGEIARSKNNLLDPWFDVVTQPRIKLFSIKKSPVKIKEKNGFLHFFTIYRCS